MARARHPVLDMCTASAGESIDIDYTAGGYMWLEQISINFSAAPTTSENITLVIDSASGAAYDRPLLTLDPSVDSLTTWEQQPEPPPIIMPGDVIKVDYANTDDLGVGVSLTLADVE